MDNNIKEIRIEEKANFTRPSSVRCWSDCHWWQDDDNTGDTSSYLDYLLSGSNAVDPAPWQPIATDGTLKFPRKTADLSNRCPPSHLGWLVDHPRSR